MDLFYTPDDRTCFLVFLCVLLFLILYSIGTKEIDMAHEHDWKPGPLPPNTWMWGGVVLVGDSPSNGFHFADFCGDHVMLCPDGRRIEADAVKLYNNCLELPPAASGVKSRAGCENKVV